MGRRVLASIPVLLAAALILPTEAQAAPARFKLGAAVAAIDPTYPV